MAKHRQQGSETKFAQYNRPQIIRAALPATILALTIAVLPAKADNLVSNGEFSSYTLPTGVGLVDGDSFSFGSQVADWSVGVGGTAVDNGRVYLYVPNTATTQGALYTPDGPGGYYVVLSGTAGDYPDPNNGGNFVGIDSGGFNYTLSQNITGLKGNTHYQLSFDTAAAQQVGYTGRTQDYWQVTLAGEPSTPVTTTVIHNPSQGFEGWYTEELDFTTPLVLTSDTLQFLAVGSPDGLPPFALLDSVSLGTVPEPATWLMMGCGLIALAGVRRLRRPNVSQA